MITKDLFISHASEDKEIFVKPLVNALRQKSIKVWYDEFELKIGDSLTQSIDKGLLMSKHGVVVLSPSFFSKNWTIRELNGLTTLEVNEGRKILPIWHNIDKEQIIKQSPTLADKVAIKSSMGIDFIVEQLNSVLNNQISETKLASEHYLNGNFKSAILLSSTQVEFTVRKLLIDKLSYQYFKNPPINRISLLKLFELGFSKKIIKGENEINFHKYCAIRNKTLHSLIEPEQEITEWFIMTSEKLIELNASR